MESTALEEAKAKPLKNDPELYSDWSGKEKFFIIVMASIAGLFSPLSANIYLPLFNILADVLQVSSTLISVTISTYMIFQGLTPPVIAGLSDGLGRRPVFILSFTLYIAANIGLALQTNYVALALLRCLQSAGSSSTIALSRAVAADISAPAERGRYISITSTGIVLGPAIGPVIGGLLAQYLGWRSVFWFLVIASSTFLVVFLLLFPETCRKIVGNGSQRPARWNMSGLTIYHLRKVQDKTGAQKQEAVTVPNVLKSLKVLADLEMLLITIANGLGYAAFHAINTSIPSAFAVIYGLNASQIGLCFLATAGGSLVALLMQGWVVDWNYKRHAVRLGLPARKDKDQDLTNFPIEVVRLEIVLPFTLAFALCTLGYGWTLAYETHLAGPLVFLFASSAFGAMQYTIISVLVVDLWPTKAATATAANNLVRCLLGAGSAAAIVPLMSAIGRGWAFVLVGFIVFATVPLIILCMCKGQGWRASKTLLES